jgi:hypothetical protein
MGCKSSYQISIPSNRIIIRQVISPRLKRCFQTHSNRLFLASKYETQILPQSKLDPWFVTGFIDGEGCFGLYTYTNAASKWYVFLDFKFTLHTKDRDLLDQIKFYFCVGEISKHGEQSINYGIRSMKYLQLIINHFYKFTLKTKKLNDYKLFKLAFNIIKNKEPFNKGRF